MSDFDDGGAILATRFEHAYAYEIAKAAVYYLAPVCHRIEIAGSIRRHKPTVKDIEIVAEPKMDVKSRDLFGEPTAESDMIEQAMQRANLCELPWMSFAVDAGTGEVKDGERYKKLIDTRTGVPIDLFLVKPPAQWGVIMMLRTGSADWNIRFLKRLDAMGLRMRDGRILDKSGVLDTPEEEDVFKVAKVKWKDPKKR